VLTFASGKEMAFVVPDISVFKFLKLHLLNGTHTLSASLACLAGYETVREGMADHVFASYVRNLQQDIARAIPYDIPENDIQEFSSKVLDRFRNPYLQHKWINITLQNTLKMRNRNVPVLVRYFQRYGTSPKYMATGFAAYLLFMKPVKHVEGTYYGTAGGKDYIINDEHAKYFYELWQGATSPGEVAEQVLSDVNLWGTNLAANATFAEAVKDKLSSMITRGVRETINNI
jgi:tagaturonate reductase